MAASWPAISLGDAGVDVIDCDHRTPKRRKEGRPYVTIPEMRGGRIDLESARKISEEDFLAWTQKALPKRYDVVLSRRTNPGETALVRDSQVFALGQNLVLLRSSGAVLAPEYLYWLTQSPEWWREVDKYLNVGAIFDSLRIGDIRRFQVPVPPRPDQLAIAALLGALDDKIELNRRMSETLEEMAQVLFKSWFVDFTDGPAAASGTDAEVGVLPAGWRTGLLGDVAVESRRGVNPSDLDPSTPYVGLEHMPRRRITLDQWGTAEGLGSGKVRFEQGEILFGKLRPYFHKVGVAPVDGVSSTDIVVLRPQAAAWYGFVLGVASSDEFIQYTDAASTGTRMPRTNWRTMAAYEVHLPPPHVARAFDALTRPMVERTIAATHESRTLGALRDALLPKLISGELRVPDAEHLVSEVA